MDARKIGKLIKDLRTEKKLTQLELAEKINVTDRAVSKWERGEGCPDITLIREIADILGVSAESLLLGGLEKNQKDPGKLIRTSFFICPVCGNIITSTSKFDISCCGRKLEPSPIKKIDNDHFCTTTPCDDELLIQFKHEMSKDHYIKFIACINLNNMYLCRLYPEQASEVHIPLIRGSKILICCNKDGIFLIN